MNTTGDRIRELRLRHHLTLDDVAKHLGVGRQAIYKYEQGTVTNIPLENLEKMAILFETTPGYLAGWASDDDHPPDITPRTVEARIISRGIDSMPKEQREAIVKLMSGLYPGLFEKGTYMDGYEE